MSQCPVCQKPTALDYAPFCSKHCQNIDLLKWMNEDYRIPVQDLEQINDLPTSSEED